MANVTITDLTETLNVNSNDVLPIVNVGANITQKVTADTLKSFVGLSGNLTGNLQGNGFGANNMTFVSSVGDVTSSGRIIANGGSLTSTLNMNNSSIVNVNGIQIADSGRTEGINWNDTNQWAIFDSPNDFTNVSGNLQFTTGNTVDSSNTAAYKRITFNTSGQVEIPVSTGTAPLKLNSTTLVSNLNSEYLGGFKASQTNSANTAVIRTSSGGITVAGITMSSLNGATVTATGNITGGNLITGGRVTATGNITGNVISATNTFSLKVYASDIARDSAISSPQPGMMVYVTGVGMQIRGATAWNTIPGTDI